MIAQQLTKPLPGTMDHHAHGVLGHPKLPADLFVTPPIEGEETKHVGLLARQMR